MSQTEKSSRTSELLVGVRSRAGAVVLLAFCLFSAIVFGFAGPQVMDALYGQISTIWPRISDRPTQFSFPRVPATIIPLGFLGGIVGIIIGGRFVRSMEKLGMRWDKMDVGDKVTLFLGVFAGLVAAVPLLQVFQFLNLEPAIRVLLYLAVTTGLSALSVYALWSMADILPWNKSRGKARRSGIKILDTNVIIDGRIYDVAKAGFLEGQLYIPKFVLEELQYIADSSDALKRQRGRRGLEVLKHMQADFPIEIGTQDKNAPDMPKEVDARIVRLAKLLGADVVTNDFNLNRVATLQDIRVLSLNDLALALRTNILPQENLPLKIIREGNQYGQGVGYLDDGTMVVVENGQPFIGETVEVLVTQVIQTERGKMIFAEVDGAEEIPSRRRARRAS